MGGGGRNEGENARWYVEGNKCRAWLARPETGQNDAARFWGQPHKIYHGFRFAKELHNYHMLYRSKQSIAYCHLNDVVLEAIHNTPVSKTSHGHLNSIDEA